MSELLSADRELTITRRFHSPRERVFRVWTEPEHMRRWMCPAEFTVIEATVDLRVGGRWRTGMRAPDGTEYFMHGVYQEIIRPERLVFTHTWEDDTQPGHVPGHDTLITITFDEVEDVTTMVFHVANLESIEGREGQRRGWSQAFEHIDTVLLGWKEN